MSQTVRQLLDSLGHTGPDHDENVRNALLDYKEELAASTRVVVILGTDGAVSVYSDRDVVEAVLVDHNVGKGAAEYCSIQVPMGGGTGDTWTLRGGFFEHEVGHDPEFVDQVFAATPHST